MLKCPKEVNCCYKGENVIGLGPNSKGYQLEIVWVLSGGTHFLMTALTDVFSSGDTCGIRVRNSWCPLSTMNMMLW